MKREIKIGLVGFGAMGKTHAFCVDNLKYYYRDLPFSASIEGICTTSLERSETIKNTYGFKKAYKSADEIITDECIDVVDVCTPNIFHYDTVKKALLAGKHVYCEKPLAVTKEEADELSALANASGLVCAVVFNNRHLAPILKAMELVKEDRIGRILSFSAEYLHNSCTDVNRPAGWKQNSDICGGGVLFDLGSHAIDLVYALCGEFESVYGIPQIAYPQRKGANGDAWETNADEAFYMLARLKNGAVGTITVSKLVNGANDDLSLEIYGEKGSIKFSLMQPNFLYFYDATIKPTELGGDSGYKAIECVGRYPAPAGAFPSPKAPVGWLRGHVESMYSFLDAIAENKKAYPDFSEGAYVQSVMDAAYRSAKEKTEIKI